MFDNGLNYVSVGHIPQYIIDSILEKFPEFELQLSSDTDILFWKDRIKHTERHKKDFASEEEYKLCFEQIPDIIQHPDFIVFILIRIVFLLFADSQTIYPLLSAYLRMENWHIGPCTHFVNLSYLTT